MQRVMFQTLVLAMVIGIALHSVACSSSDNAGNLAGDLEDRLTDALDFDDGSVTDGAPPEGSDDSGAPQVDAVQGQDLRLGASFAFELESSFTTPENVDRAIVHVQGASKHIVVQGTLAANIASLAGRLKNDPQLAGKSFVLEFALQTIDGVTGLYHTFPLTILDSEAQMLTAGQEIAAVLADGEIFHETGRPDGNSGSDYPQITVLTAPLFLAPGEAFTLALETDYSAAITGVIMTTPGNTAYKEIQQQGQTGSVTVLGRLSGDNLSSGDRIVIQVALAAENGAGRYRSWWFEVKDNAIPVDGDEDEIDSVDGDDEIDMEETVEESENTDSDETSDVIEEESIDGDVDEVSGEPETSDELEIVEEAEEIETGDADSLDTELADLMEETEDEAETETEMEAESEDVPSEPLPITCLCELMDDCCDGCNPINDFGTCDDRNGQTDNDRCFGGICQGITIDCTLGSAPAICSDMNGGTFSDFCVDGECTGNTQACLENVLCLDTVNHTDCCTRDLDCCGDSYCNAVDRGGYGACMASRRMTGTRSMNNLIAFSEDGRFFALGERTANQDIASNITIFETKSNTPVRVIKAVPMQLNSIAFGRGASADLLAAASKRDTMYTDYGYVRVFNWKTGELVSDVASSEYMEGYRVEFSPSGNKLSYTMCASAYYTCTSGSLVTEDVSQWRTSGITRISAVSLSNGPVVYGAFDFVSEDVIALAVTTAINTATAKAEVWLYDMTQTAPVVSDSWTVIDAGGSVLPYIKEVVYYENTGTPYVITVDMNNGVAVRNLTSDTSTQPVTLSNTFAAVAVSDDGQWLALSTNTTYASVTSFYNPSDWTLAATLSKMPEYISGSEGKVVRPVSAMRFAPDSPRLQIITSSKKVISFDPSVAEPMARCLNTHCSTIADMEVASHGGFAVTSGYDNQTIIWDIERAAIRSRIDNQPEFSNFIRMDLSPDAVWLLQGNSDMLKVSRIADGFELFSTSDGTNTLKDMIFSPDGSFFVTTDSNTSANGTLRFYDTWYGELFRELPFTGSVSRLSLSPDGSRLVHSRYYITVYDTSTGAELKRFQGPFSTTDDIVMIPDGVHVAVSNDGAFRIVNLETEAVVASWSFTCGNSHMAVSPDGVLLACGCENSSSEVRLYDVPAIIAQGGTVTHTRTIYTQNPVGSLRFTPDAKTLVVQEYDPTLENAGMTLYDIQGLAAPYVYECSAHTDCQQNEFCNLYLHRCVPGQCGDGIDNDQDGFTDDQDRDCAGGYMEFNPQIEAVR